MQTNRTIVGFCGTRHFISALLAFLLFSASTGALAQSANDPIIVDGDRAEEAELTADVAKSITLRQPAGKPLPRHYDPICIKVFGLDTDYSEVLADRMRENMRALNLVLLGDGCSPTIWVGFVSDSHAAVTKLRTEDPEMFGDLRDYEIDRVLAGSKASQAWFAREDKGRGGRAFDQAAIGGRPVRVNREWHISRITGSIRVDMIGSIVLFDRKLSAGRTIRQLADYATFRALAPVKELVDEADNPQSILTLFADGSSPAAGLTEFDWSYLSGFYKLSEYAEARSMHDAAKRAFLDGSGQKKSEETSAPATE